MKFLICLLLCSCFVFFWGGREIKQGLFFSDKSNVKTAKSKLWGVKK